MNLQLLGQSAYSSAFVQGARLRTANAPPGGLAANPRPGHIPRSGARSRADRRRRSGSAPPRHRSRRATSPVHAARSAPSPASALATARCCTAATACSSVSAPAASGWSGARMTSCCTARSRSSAYRSASGPPAPDGREASRKRASAPAARRSPAPAWRIRRSWRCTRPTSTTTRSTSSPSSIDGDTLAQLIARRTRSPTRSCSRSASRSPTRSPTPTRAASSTATSSPRTCSSPTIPAPHETPAKLTDFGGASLVGRRRPHAHRRDARHARLHGPRAERRPRGRRARGPLLAGAGRCTRGSPASTRCAARTPAATARRIGRPLPPLAARRPDLPRALTRALDTALAIDPAAARNRSRTCAPPSSSAGARADPQARPARPAAAPMRSQESDGSDRPSPRARDPCLARRRAPRSRAAPRAPTRASRPPAGSTPALGHRPKTPPPADAPPPAGPPPAAAARGVGRGACIAVAVWQVASARPGVALLLLAVAAPLLLIGSAPRRRLAGGRARAGARPRGPRGRVSRAWPARPRDWSRARGAGRARATGGWLSPSRCSLAGARRSAPVARAAGPVPAARGLGGLARQRRHPCHRPDAQRPGSLFGAVAVGSRRGRAAVDRARLQRVLDTLAAVLWSAALLAGHALLRRRPVRRRGPAAATRRPPRGDRSAPPSRSPHARCAARSALVILRVPTRPAAHSRWPPIARHPAMNPLRALETRIANLVEGAFGRVFRSEVRPIELAHKLAREMDEHRTASVSRTYAPNEYSVWLSPQDRARYEGVEQEVIDELCAYLLEHARREDLILASQPQISFHTDEELSLGEFGIQARLVRADGHSDELLRGAGGGGATGRALRRTWADDDLQQLGAYARSRRAGAGAPPRASAAVGRRQAPGGAARGWGGRAQPRLRHRARGHGRLPPPRRASPRRGRLDGRRSRLDQRRARQRSRHPRAPPLHAGDRIELGSTEIVFDVS